jgi:protein disulfide-isomerase
MPPAEAAPAPDTADTSPPATSTRARPKLLLSLTALFLLLRIATGIHEALSPPRPGGLVQWVAPAGAETANLGAHKPVLYDFSATWCDPCKQMERELFSDPTSANFINSTFIPVRVADEDPSEAATALRHRYGVVALPTLIVVRPDSKEPSRLQGFPGRRQAMGFLRAARGGTVH